MRQGRWPYIVVERLIVQLAGRVFGPGFCFGGEEKLTPRQLVWSALAFVTAITVSGTRWADSIAVVLVLAR